MSTPDRIAQLAELAVVFGANVQKGQIVGVSAEPDHAELVHAIAAAAYRQGALFVDVSYFDPWVKRARIEHAADETLDFVPPWLGSRVLALGEEGGALIRITGVTAPGVLEDLDPARAGRDLLPRVKESARVVGERTVNWTIVPLPTRPWARQVHPELEEEQALERLWEEIEHVCRLDAPDAVAAWRERMEVTARAVAALNERRFDALRFEGPGTDLTIGLLPTSTWWNVGFETVDGVEHVPNIPSEEVFTSPDPERADGFVRATKPLVLEDGTLVSGLEVRFENGRAVSITADTGGDVLATRCEVDEGATHLGEVALVDREGRVGALDTIFYNTLLDENAASHIALGSGFEFAVGEHERGRVAHSASHVDFMIGSPDVAVTGVTRAGERVPVLRDGSWLI